MRSSLELYYSRLGPTTDIVIELLPGSYTPRFKAAAADHKIDLVQIENPAISNACAFTRDNINIIQSKSKASQRLLILEDNIGLKPILRRIGIDSGYFVVEAGQANEFWLAYHALKPTHIILDLVLPGADGLEIMRELGRISAKSQITILSGVDPRILRTAERMGKEFGLNIIGAMSKPFAVDALSTLLQKSHVSTDSIEFDELSDAIDQSALELYYQPKISWDREGNSRLEGLEGLVRWNHPTKGLLLPDKIIVAAEEGRLTDRLTQYVIEQAISQLKLLNNTYPDLTISINVAASALDDINFPDHLAFQMDQAKLARNRLVLEIKEAIAFSDIHCRNDSIVRLGLKGFSLSLDDFGSGHSSLLSLLRMPFNLLKIDRYFIRECAVSEEAKTIVRSVIELTHSLKIRSCAVGIENSLTLKLLRELGCDLAQGDLFSTPVSSTNLIAMLQATSATQW